MHLCKKSVIIYSQNNTSSYLFDFCVPINQIKLKLIWDKCWLLCTNSYIICILDSATKVINTIKNVSNRIN